MKRLLFLAALLLLATACASTKTSQTKTADEYLLEGERLFENEQYQEAIASWEKVREAFYSPELNVLAELKIAEAYYLAKEYVEAAAAYEDFLKQHPDHPRTAEALFQLGMSFYQQILDVDRDQTATSNALVTFETLLKQFPDHPKREEARALAARCRNRLAAHELYVGRFYLRTGHYQAAIKRLEGISARYPGFTDLDQAYFCLGQAYLKAGDRQQAAAAFNTLITMFPQSKHRSEAQNLLETTD